MPSKNIIWEKDAENRLKKIPFFVRKIAKRKIEATAMKQGLPRVTSQLIEQTKEKEMPKN